MPSKKQIRRQQKLKRHDYEEVYLDDEGRELAPEEAEELLGASRSAKATKTKTPPVNRAGRTIEPPSWRRTGRRGLLFFPLMLVVVILLGEDLTLPQQIVQTLVLMAFFLPFSYFMDSMMWRSFRKRLGTPDEPRKPSG